MSAKTVVPSIPATLSCLNEELNKLLLQAQEAESSGQTDNAVAVYIQFINSPSSSSDVLRSKEDAIVRAGLLLQQDEARLAAMVRALEPAWLVFPRAKTAKTIRSLLDLFPAHSPILSSLLQELIEWCTRDRRFYLKQALQIKLAAVQFANGHFAGALDILGGLGTELRRLDDKLSLVEVHLLESQILFAVKAMAKAKAALTAARTNANAVYCPTLLMADIDLQSGLLHADDGDYNTAASYFIESLDGFTLARADGGVALKYLLLCKVVLGQDLQSALDSKSAMPHLAVGAAWIEAFKAISSAYQEKSLQSFDKALLEYQSLLQSDKTIQQHLHNLYDALLENNLLKLVAPFSHVPLVRLADELQLGVLAIEQKLCQMVLDGKLHAVIDQHPEGVYLVRAEPSGESPLYTAAITAVRNLDAVVDALYDRARSIQ